MTKTIMVDPISGELRIVLRALKLGKLPSRPARTARPGPANNTCRPPISLTSPSPTRSHAGKHLTPRCARGRRLDPSMCIDTWDTIAAVRYDQ